MTTKDTADTLILMNYYSKLFPILSESEKIDYSRSKFSPPYFVYYIREVERLGAVPRLSRIIFGKEDKLNLVVLYDSDALIRDWETKKKRFGLEKPETYVHLAIAYWYCRDSFRKAKMAIECLQQNIPPKYKIESVLFELMNLFPNAQDGSFLAFSVFLSLGMIKEAKPMFNFMGFREDADFEFFKGASFLFDEKYGEAKDCFNRLAKNGDSLAEAYYYWALSLEETQKKDRAKAVMTFRKCYESFKKSVPIYSWGILDERFDKGEKPLPMLPQACFVKDVILNRLEYSRKREVLVVARKPASSEEEKAEYEIWDIKGKKPAFKKVVDDLRNRNKRGKLDIFVDEDGAVYFKGKKVKELKKTQILYDFLLYFLKNKGVGGTYRELFVSVWEKGDVSISFTMNKYKKDNVIRMKNRLNTLLKDYEIKEVVYEYSKYRFPEDLEFCVIEKYIYEEHNQNQ